MRRGTALFLEARVLLLLWIPILGCQCFHPVPPPRMITNGGFQGGGGGPFRYVSSSSSLSWSNRSPLAGWNGPSRRHYTCPTELYGSDDDDDGWIDDTSTDNGKGTLEKDALLKRSAKDQRRDQSIQSPPREAETEERDLFIPIFTLVSLAGLFGAYGYEMLRLYLRGELYLPWNS